MNISPTRVICIRCMLFFVLAISPMCASMISLTLKELELCRDVNEFECDFWILNGYFEELGAIANDQDRSTTFIFWIPFGFAIWWCFAKSLLKCVLALTCSRSND